MPAIWTYILAAIAVVAGAGGLLALLGGLRGRQIDNHPWCRRCGHDLDGRWPGATHWGSHPHKVAGGDPCPACKSDLERVGAVELGRRRRSPQLVAVGAAAIAISATSALIVAPAGLWWNAWKPNWLLVYETHSSSTQRSGAALRELATRLRRGVSDRQLDRLVAEGLHRQRQDEGDLWTRDWGTFIEHVWLAGRLSEADAHAYALQTCSPTLFLGGEPPAPGVPLPVGLRFDEFRRSHFLELSFHLLDAAIDGVPMEVPGHRPGRSGVMPGSQSVTHLHLPRGTTASAADLTPPRLRGPLPPGEYEIETLWSLHLRPPRNRPGMEIVWEVTVRKLITVGPPRDENAPRGNHDQ